MDEKLQALIYRLIEIRDNDDQSETDLRIKAVIDVLLELIVFINK